MGKNKNQEAAEAPVTTTVEAPPEIPMSLAQAKKMVEARKAHLKAIKRENLTPEELKECYELEIYKRPKESKPECFARILGEHLSIADGKISYPKFTDIDFSPVGSTDDEMKKAFDFWGKIIPVIFAAIEAKLNK